MQIESLTPPLPSLDDLLADAMRAADEQKKVSQARERLKKNKVKASDREETEALIRSWEARNLWKPMANVALFEYVTCTCCQQFNTNFLRMMQKQVHRNNPQITRLIAMGEGQEMDAALPKLVARQVTEVDICEYCAADAGFDILNPDIEL